jgi:hypothetical protein
MNIINGWKNPNKQSDKYQCKLRLGRVTVYDVFYDFGDRKGAVTLMNFTVKLFKKAKKEVIKNESENVS